MRDARRGGQFSYLWEYRVPEEHMPAYLAAYGPDGEWAQLFRRDPAYVETVLLRDALNPNRFITIDYWESKASRDAFRIEHADEFRALDQRCEAFTKSEHNLGDFLVVP